jgi:GcrA cell cycle regulator
MFQVKWTESQDDQMKALWTEGWSAGKIAEAIGQGTRNAIIGRAHRLGLANKQGPKRVPKISLRPYNPSSLASRVVPLPRMRVPRPAYPRDNTPLPGIGGGNGLAPFIPPNPITIIELTDRHCHWPIGDPATPEFRYCGYPIACEGKVYCAEHCAIAYLPPRARAA